MCSWICNSFFIANTEYGPYIGDAGEADDVAEERGADAEQQLVSPQDGELVWDAGENVLEQRELKQQGGV